MPLTPKNLMYLYFDSKLTILQDKYDNLLHLLLYGNDQITYDDIETILELKIEIEITKKIEKEINSIL